MADRQGVGIAYIVSLCGIMSGLAVAMMFCLGMIPGFEYVSPMVAGVLVWIVRERLGVRYGMACFAAVGLLTMLFTANYEASMMFIFLLGYYPIVRQYIMKLKAAVLRWVVKLALYAVAAVSWPEQVVRYPQPYTPLPLWNASAVPVSSTIEDTLRSGGILNLNSLAIALGEFAAPMGTGAALVILACGLVLWTQKDVHIGASASFLITCGLIAFFFPRQVGLADSTLFSSLMPRLQGVRDELHTGAMLFCAVFLLNEPYTCAHHRLGRILYGALVGIATMGFRYFGVYETGVCFALLAVNSVSALIDRTEERLYRLLHRLPSERKEAAE